MVVVRNRVSALRAGGPRQFSELRDKVLIRVESDEAKAEVLSELDSLGLTGEELKNAPVVSAEPRNQIEDVLENLREAEISGRQLREGIQEIQQARDEGQNFLDASVATVAATREFINEVSGLPRVNVAEFVRTAADFGPENLRISPSEMETLETEEAEEKTPNLGDTVDSLGIRGVWNQTRGEEAVVAIFDTGFAEDLIDSSRLVNTFHAGGTTSPFASAEGHGTMCAGASAANSDEGVPFDGAAPDAGVILVRITDSDGQIRSDVISKAWDWLMDRDLRRPIIANHSYGTPLCSGRPRTKFCDTVENDVIKIANATSDITSIYAAGNEAMRCGHRPSGVTSAITGTNSLQEVIAVGALLSNGREAQRYSSHGRGDCSPVSDPKPNVSCPIPKFTYYGGEDGWMIKDMSTGPFGSGGGTSHAAPLTAGMVALLQSKAMKESDDGEAMQTEEIKQIIEDTAEPPRTTQVNAVGLLIGEKGYDARFGNGRININAAMEEV